MELPRGYAPPLFQHSLDATPTMGAPAPKRGTGWEARPVAPPPAGPAGPPGGERWGVRHRPTGRWVAFGREAQCRRLAARLTELDAS
jgi:hypothetical protein